MTITNIISAKRAQLTERGLLPRLQQTALSSNIANARPSMRTVRQAAAFMEQKSLIASTPFSFLFDFTIPALQPALMEKGDEHFKAVLDRLCDHGQRMIERHGKATYPYLDDLFKAFPLFIGLINDGCKTEMVLEALEKCSFNNDDAGLVKCVELVISDHVRSFIVDNEGHVHIQIKSLDDLCLYFISLIGNRVFSLNLRLCGKIPGSGLDCINTFVNLRELNLHLCGLKDDDLLHLRELTCLHKLVLDDSSIDGSGLAFLKNLTELRELSLDNCHYMTNEGLNHLESLKALEVLSLYWCGKITDAGIEVLSGLGSLRKLNLANCRITDTGIGHLTGLSNLKEIDLSDCFVSDEGHNLLKRQIPNIDILDC